MRKRKNICKKNKSQITLHSYLKEGNFGKNDYYKGWWNDVPFTEEEKKKLRVGKMSLQDDLDFLRDVSVYETKKRRGGYSHATLAEYIAKAYDVCSQEPVYVRELARIWRKEKGRGSYIFLASYALRFLFERVSPEGRCRC